MSTPRGKLLLAGVTFAILWASASAGTKVGLSAVQPLVFFVPHGALHKRFIANT